MYHGCAIDLKVVLISENKVVLCQNLFDQFYEVFCRGLLEWCASDYITALLRWYEIVLATSLRLNQKLQVLW